MRSSTTSAYHIVSCRRQSKWDQQRMRAHERTFTVGRTDTKQVFSKCARRPKFPQREGEHSWAATEHNQHLRGGKDLSNETSVAT
jgi:hypothetical protein